MSEIELEKDGGGQVQAEGELCWRRTQLRVKSDLLLPSPGLVP